jgi:hypothetical protein
VHGGILHGAPKTFKTRIYEVRIAVGEDAAEGL